MRSKLQSNALTGYRLGIATAAVAGVTALDVYCSLASRAPKL
ncbi:MAG TPA: hypothetical protein VH815_01920 [Acidobacteriota bacterium]